MGNKDATVERLIFWAKRAPAAEFQVVMGDQMGLNRLLLYNANRPYNTYCRSKQRYCCRLLHISNRLYNAERATAGEVQGVVATKSAHQGCFWPYCSIPGTKFSAVARSVKGFNRRSLKSVASLIEIAG